MLRKLKLFFLSFIPLLFVCSNVDAALYPWSINTVISGGATAAHTFDFSDQFSTITDASLYVYVADDDASEIYLETESFRILANTGFSWTEVVPSTLAPNGDTTPQPFGPFDFSSYILDGPSLSVHVDGTYGDWYLQKVDVYVEGSPVPIPGAVWLLGSGLIGIVGIRRKIRS